ATSKDALDATAVLMDGSPGPSDGEPQRDIRPWPGERSATRRPPCELLILTRRLAVSKLAPLLVEEASMCFVEAGWTSWQPPVSRRRFLGSGLAAGVAAATVDWSKSLLLPGVAEGAQTPPASGGPGTAGVKMTWFGTDGWEITFGNKTILLDPWFSR